MKQPDHIAAIRALRDLWHFAGDAGQRGGARQMTDTIRVAMRGRGKLNDVVGELRRQIDARVDFVADCREMSVKVGDDGKVRIMPSDSLRDFMPREGVVLLDQALTQLAGRIATPMPIKFTRQAIEAAPRRWEDYVTGVMHDLPKRWLMRLLDDKVRAVLSDRFRIIESLDVAKAALEGALQTDGVRVIEASITDSHLRIKFVNPEVWAALTEFSATAGDHEFLKPGANASPTWLRNMPGIEDVKLQGGPTTLWPIVTIGNSDTGHGLNSAKIGAAQGICMNLATIETMVANVHLGQRMELGMFGADTISAEAKAIALKSRDVVKAAFDEEKFRAMVERCKKTDSSKVAAPATAMKNLIKVSGGTLYETDLDALVAAFSKERDTVYGVGQAVARLAQDVPDVDRATHLEEFAGSVLVGKHSRAIQAMPVMS
tara:strand:+ start:8358 stop:9650 length:1293 start_codon:yes stop_codon:yes gene_type:complete